ncbi:TPA: helix-turn-helix domain-containing protein, partial [Klebsiella pneumoniae]|nr:helix-turn-helix domain-containing protein [Klebsiella pneumoniae]
MNALEKAIKNAGNATKLAEKLDVSSMTISHWKKRCGGLVPQGRISSIFQVT